MKKFFMIFHEFDHDDKWQILCRPFSVNPTPNLNPEHGCPDCRSGMVRSVVRICLVLSVVRIFLARSVSGFSVRIIRTGQDVWTTYRAKKSGPRTGPKNPDRKSGQPWPWAWITLVIDLVWTQIMARSQIHTWKKSRIILLGWYSKIWIEGAGCHDYVIFESELQFESSRGPYP